MMRCPHRVAQHLNAIQCSGTRAACTSIGAESTASLCMPNTMIPGHSFVESFCSAASSSSAGASKSVCISARSCGCSQCSAGRSSSSHRKISNGADLTAAEMQSASGYLRHTQMSQRLRGLVAGEPQQQLRSYGSFSSTRQDHQTQGRSYATLEDSQSKVSDCKHPTKPQLPCCMQHILTVALSLQLDAINDAFVEARDEIEYALEVCPARRTYLLPCNRSHIIHPTNCSRCGGGLLVGTLLLGVFAGCKAVSVCLLQS